MSLIEKTKISVLMAEKSYSAAPFIVYRSAKYEGIRERAFHALMTYGRFYLISPFINRIRGVEKPILNIFAFLLCIATSPLFLLMFIGLFLLRKLRIYIIQKYYPNLSICEDLSPRRFLSEDKEEGIVTSVIWVKGHIDVSNLRSHLLSRIQSGNLQILQKQLGSRLTLRVWEEPSQPFEIDKHVVQAPAKFFDCLITDDTTVGGMLGGKSEKSVLEKYVTSRTSIDLERSSPPWQITLVPLPLSLRRMNSRNSRTCVVLRFHKLLLQRPEVLKMLVTSLDQSGGIELTNGIQEVHWISGITFQKADQVMEVQSQSRINNQEEERIQLSENLFNYILNEYKSTLSDLITWYQLRMKQYEFHTKTNFAKCIWSELMELLKSIIQVQTVQSLKCWESVKSQFLQLFKVLQAISFIPSVLFECFIGSRGNNGLRRNEKRNTRHVSWSKPISMDLLQDIQNKTQNASEETILLTACSLALRDYYFENCLSNPKTIGVIVSRSSSSSGKSCRDKLLDLPTKFCNISEEINKTERELESYPECKQLAQSYLQEWSSYFLPRPLSFLVFNNLCKRYPIRFNYIDTESPFPHLSLWGQTVDEFTFWGATPSNSCVSISVVKYAGSVRLSILSPMKCVDCIISQRFGQYLNKLAESVGVEKNRIPYSRKSSPISTAASSPDQKRTLMALSTKLNSFSSENGNKSLTRRYNSCISLQNHLN